MVTRPIPGDGGNYRVGFAIENLSGLTIAKHHPPEASVGL